MKKLFLLAALWSGMYCSAQVKVEVDPRLELTGIVFYLSGADEYAEGRIPQYTKKIDAYFGRYKNHPLIAYIRELREKYSIGYNAAAVSGLAMVLDNNKIAISPNISLTPVAFDPRWHKDILERYATLLDDFSGETDFMKFYAEQADFYAHIEKAAEKLVENIHFEWFDDLFNLPMTPMILYASPASGKNNYAVISGCGLTPYDTPAVILGCTHAASDGTPQFDIRDLEVLLHEFCHHFTAPLYASYLELMRTDAACIFPYVKNLLERVGYGNAETMCCEWLNELAVNMYLQQYEPDLLKYRIERDENSGFVWMGKSVEYMDDFHADRVTYASMNAYMPKLVFLLHTIAKNIESVMTEFHNRHPYVVESFPANGDSAVPTDIKEIIITFSKPLYHGVQAVRRVSQDIPTPDISEIKWVENGLSYILTIDGMLTPNTEYGIRLPYQFFIDNKTGHRMKEDYVLIFSTN